MMWLLRIFALHALLFAGVLICHHVLLPNNIINNRNNNAVVVQAFTLKSINRVTTHKKIFTESRRLKLASASSTREKSDATTNNDPRILFSLEMSPEELSNEQQQSLIIIKPQAPIVPVITTSMVSQISDIVDDTTATVFTIKETTKTTTPQEMVDVEVQRQRQQQQSELSIWAARGLLLLVAAIWGTNFASVKYLENLCFHPPCHHPPSEAALARFGLAATVSIPLLINQNWNVIRAGLECGLWISLGYFSQALALSTIDAGQCAFICSLTVVFVPVAAAVLYNKPIKPYNLLAASIALAGVGVLEGMVNINSLLGIAPAIAAVVPHTTDIVLSSGPDVVGAVSEASTGPLMAIANTLGVNKGDILALGQPIGFGTAFLRIEQYQEQLKDVPNRILTIAAAQCVAVGIMSLIWVLYDFHGTIPNFSYMIEPHRIAAIGWTGIVTTVVAIFIEGIALQKASATDASLAFSTEPIWASLFGFILLHETLGINSYVGGALILTACLVGAIADLKTSPAVRSEE